MSVWAPVSVSVAAVLFAVFSFWWMYWRRGKLRVGNFRYIAAGTASESGKSDVLLIGLPLVFWNSGAQPLLIDALRPSPADESGLPTLHYECAEDRFVHAKYMLDRPIQRDYDFLPLALRPNEIVRGNVLFQAGRFDQSLDTEEYFFSLEAKILDKRHWITLREVRCDFRNLTEEELNTLRYSYSVYPYGNEGRGG